jgi:hypothetical protein
MSKKTRSSKSSAPTKQSPWAVPIVILIVVAFVAGAFVVTRQGSFFNSPPPPSLPTTSAPREVIHAQPLTEPSTAPPNSGTQTMEVAKAVMVTAELDGVKTIPEALVQIERRYAPDDGIGRTFAILDAYGELTQAGKLHIQMHVSSEKPGQGALVFKPTGEVLWNSKIEKSAGPMPPKNLTIYIGDDKGSTWIIDGSNNPASILDAKVRDKGILLRDFWPDGAEREATFVYSACGCPVKTMVRRTGNRTARTTELPVMFPDDADGYRTISRLMGW